MAFERPPCFEAERTNGLCCPSFAVALPLLPIVAFIAGTYLELTALPLNFPRLVALKTLFCFEYLSRFFNVFCFISSTLDFSISSSKAQRSRLVF